jgi:hypothetical protein
MSAEARAVTLHVGTPKSGTTSLQNILARNPGRVREHGYLYPGENPGHFIEALSLRGSGFRGHRFPASEGAWERVVGEVEAHDGPALLSHEILGGSVPKVVRKAVRAFEGRPVRVVVTCRDLGRQLPAVWQEGVKNGETETYGSFLAEAFGDWKGPGSATGFWRGQNLASVGERWADAVGPENVRFVTVPPAGSSNDVLWQRFRQGAGLPDVEYATPDQPRNPSLGTVETELLRRVVARLPEDLPWPTYSRQVKRRLAQRRLVKEKTGGTLTVPSALRPATEQVATEMVEALRAGGYTVLGDLDDLRPAFRDDGTDPDEVSPEQLLDRALDVLVPLVLGDQPGGAGAAKPGSRGK